MENGGANIDKLTFKLFSDTHRGIHATRDIKKDEKFLFVPKDLIIHMEFTKNSPLVK
jgi:hypothetical protein